MKDFYQMTAAEIETYRGPVFRATVAWFSRDGRRQLSNLESTTMDNLNAKIERLQAARGRKYDAVTYGMHTPDLDRLAIEDAQPMPKIAL
mgnify:FL=1